MIHLHKYLISYMCSPNKRIRNSSIDFIFGDARDLEEKTTSVVSPRDAGRL